MVCLYLFGSIAAKKDNTKSDVDIGILFDGSVPKEQYTGRILNYMDRLSRQLDREIDCVVLNNAATVIKFQIIKNGDRLYERLNRKDHQFEVNAMLEYFDFLPIKNRLEASMLAHIRRTDNG